MPPKGTVRDRDGYDTRPLTVCDGIDPLYVALGVSWRRALRASNLSPRTLDTYLYAWRCFGRFLVAQEMPQRPAAIRREHVEAWLVAMFSAGYKAGTVVNRYLGTHAWFTWLEEEEHIAESPMRRMKTPRAPEEFKPMLSEAQVSALLATCAGGKSFADRRDYAILMLLFDTGMRRGELASLRLEHVNLDEQFVVVRAKGRSDRVIAFGRQTVRVLDSYLLRARAAHARAGDPHLFIGQHGAMGGTGIYWVLQQRAKQAGIEHLHPHMLRHLYSHLFLAAGGQESDLMAQNGWTSPKMARVYGRSLREQRAREAAKKLSPADRMASMASGGS